LTFKKSLFKDASHDRIDISPSMSLSSIPATPIDSNSLYGTIKHLSSPIRLTKKKTRRKNMVSIFVQ
jgi:hypothetical protein